MNGGTYDNIILKEDNLTPGYVDTINHFWIYALPHPLPLPAGLFYVGTMQPAFGGSDSLYFGLDVNRVGSNHAFYNVGGLWNPSQISGAIMIRPLLGQTVATTTGISSVHPDILDWSLSPNPALDEINVDFNSPKNVLFSVSDIQGRSVLSGTAIRRQSIDISALAPGMYFVTLYVDGVASTTRKLIKQ